MITAFYAVKNFVLKWFKPKMILILVVVIAALVAWYKIDNYLEYVNDIEKDNQTLEENNKELREEIEKMKVRKEMRLKAQEAVKNEMQDIREVENRLREELAKKEKQIKNYDFESLRKSNNRELVLKKINKSTAEQLKAFESLSDKESSE